jgi:hypothetical protein
LAVGRLPQLIKFASDSNPCWADVIISGERALGGSGSDSGVRVVAEAAKLRDLQTLGLVISATRAPTVSVVLAREYAVVDLGPILLVR